MNVEVGNVYRTTSALWFNIVGAGGDALPHGTIVTILSIKEEKSKFSSTETFFRICVLTNVGIRSMLVRTLKRFEHLSDL